MDGRQSKPSKRSLATPRMQIPRRSSSADGRSSMGPATARSNRSSVRSTWTPAAGTAGSRRSSSMSFMDGRLSQSAQRPASMKDQRPFTDKAYLAECAEQLYAFLKEQGYPHSITPQLLSRISAREFENVFTFLMQFLEPKFHLGKGVRMEDAVFERLRNLRYPFPLQKSMLTGIGSQPHKALAIITWLADAVKYFTTVNPLENFFCATDSPPTQSPGFQTGSGNSAALLGYCLQSKEEENHDEFLDGLVLDTFGPVEPVEEMKERLAEQEAELQRLTALVEEQDELEQLLDREKVRVQHFETYFSDMAVHFENRRAEVQANEEAVRVINAQKEELKEQLAKQQALLREQRGRQEDRHTLQQKEQRLWQSLSAVQSEVEALKEQQQLLSMTWYSNNEELRAANMKLQASFATAAVPLRRGLPRSVLDDFDSRPVEDARSLQRHQACNKAAVARATSVLEQTEADLQGSICQDQELCEQYMFKTEDLQRELQLKEELISKRKSYFATQTADKRKRAQELDEAYAELSKKCADLELKTMSASDEQAKALADANKRLAEAQKKSTDAAALHKDTMVVSDDARRQVKQAVKASYDEHLRMMQQCYNKVIEATKELQAMKIKK